MLSDNKMKIVYSMDKYLDITANWIYYQFKSLSDSEISILCQNKENIALFPYEKVYALSDLPLWRQTLNRIIRKGFGKMCYPYHKGKIKQLSPCLIHSHFGTRGYADLELKKTLNIPLITSFYGIDATMVPLRYPYWKTRYKELFAKGDLFLVESKNMFNILSSLGCDLNKIKIQSLGVDLGNIEMIERSFSGKGLKIFIASSFREKKGIPDSLEAIAKMRSMLGNFTITIAGGIVDLRDSIEEGEKIDRAIEKFGLKNHVTFLGFLEHDALIKESYKHDIFFATSKTAKSGDNEGGTNIVILEMAASGMPILATDHCDFSYAVGPENRKFLANENDVNSISEQLGKLLRADWKLIAQTNRQHIEANFDIEKQSRKLQTIYKSVVSTHN